MSVATHGPWTEGTARLSAKGGLCTSGKGKGTIEDIYKVILPRGTRPAPGKFGIPDYGDLYTPDASEGDDFGHLYVKDIAFSQPDPTSLTWEARVKYEKRGGSQGAGGDVDDGEWTAASVGFQSYQEELTKDADETPVVNSAGDAFENAPMIERDLLLITLVKRCRNSPVATVAELNGTINSGAESVLGVSIDARCGRVSLEATRLFGTRSEWSLTIKILVNPATWDISVLQNGYRYNDENGNKVKFTETTADGRVVECSTPQLLGPTGEGGDGRGRGPYYATFKPYPAASWTRLGLPSDVGGGTSAGDDDDDDDDGGDNNGGEGNE